MRKANDEPMDLREILYGTLEVVANLDVKNPDLMKYLAQAKVIAEVSDKAIKHNMYRLQLRNLNRIMTVEPKPLKLLAR